MSVVRLILAICAGLIFTPVHAALTIEITQGVEGAVPVAVVPFGWAGAGPGVSVDISGIIAADLQRSGRFAPLPEEDLIARPQEPSQVNFRDWRLLRAENLVIGKVRPMSGGYNVQFQLYDVFRGTQLAAYSVRSGPNDLRRAAHEIADIIYETLTGEPGAFATRIAYVTETRIEGQTRYSLQVADADGYKPQAIVTSLFPLMSPSWSPDGTRLAYVTFENRRAEIYVQDVTSGRRELVSADTGHNGAPSWSPDGRRLALVLSKDGNPEIYVKELGGKALRRMTNNSAIDTEPVWAPDGQSLVFTSDRGGSPQLYRIAVSGGEPKRLTFEGSYNSRASFSPDGSKLSLVHGEEGNRYRIAVLDLKAGALQVLTDGRLDESPSFAPNGSMIIYATEDRGRGILAAVSVDGRVKQRLTLQEGSAREPVWSPFTK